MLAPLLAVPVRVKSLLSTPLTASVNTTVKFRLPLLVGVALARTMAAAVGAVLSITKVSLTAAASALPEVSVMLLVFSVST